MRAFSFCVGRGASLTAAAAGGRVNTYDPASIRERLNRSMRRRLSDDLINLIRRACLSGHIQAAEGLLTVLIDQLAREKQQFPRGRRPDEDVIEVLRGEIESSKARRDAA